ncbi:MAG: hypothetical protein HYS24_11475 [Ignavibacteriales bacterium]|nr:hypothetical protein [Ignavibacteriales bacterium]
MNEHCKCGHKYDHPLVIHECEYSKWGWFLLTILGLSAKPKSVKFICANCNEQILATSDENILKKFVGR